MFILNGLKFDINGQHVIGDVQYPRGWFLDADNRAALGIVEVPDPVKPDPELFTYVENPDGSLTATPRAAAEIAQRQAAAAEQARFAAVEQAISADTVVAQLKGMSNEQFDAWWAANVTTAGQAIAVLKRIARIVVRRTMF